MTVNVIRMQVGGKLFDNFEAGADFFVDKLIDAMEGTRLPLAKALRVSLNTVHSEMVKRHSSRWDGSVAHSNPDLFKRSGDGLTSVARSVRVRARTFSAITGEISAGLLSVHEVGATIKARSSRYLTVPLPAALDSRGVPLLKRARDWPNTFVARSRKGNLIIFQRRGPNIVPLYVLKTSVTIRPRLGMRGAIEDEMKHFEARAIQILERALSGVRP